MKKLTSETKLNSLLPLKTIGGFLTAGVLLFGAASCGTERGNEENAVVEEEYEEGLAVEETETVGNTWGDWDANEDNYWDENEFETVANDAGLYEGWDANNDGLYGEDELNTGFYGMYDANNDDLWTEDEFNTWNTAWGGAYGDYWDTWDTNDDGYLDANEYNAGIGEAGVYDDWDVDDDGLYSDDELNDGLYSTWDADDDGYLTEEEYDRVGYNFWGV